METSGLISHLTRLGLTTYEAKAYVALIRRGSSTAAEVARLALVPRQRIYDVLATLVEKGLASTRPGRVVKYVAAAPDAAIHRMVADHRQKLEDLERDADDMVRQLEPAYSAGQGETDPLDYIEVLRDRGAINERFQQLERGIKNEILVFTKPPYATPPQENVEGLEVARTHEVRTVYEWSILDDPATKEGVRGFVEAGEQARFVEKLPLKLVIIDQTMVMFGMQDPVAGSSDFTMVVVEHPELAGTLKTAFESVWEQGLTLDDALARLPVEARATAA